MPPSYMHTTEEIFVQVNCQAFFNSNIRVPIGLTKEEQIAYIKEHMNQIPIRELNFISGSCELDVENSNF